MLGVKVILYIYDTGVNLAFPNTLIWMSVFGDNRWGRKTVAKYLNYLSSKFMWEIDVCFYKLTCGLCYEILVV